MVERLGSRLRRGRARGVRLGPLQLLIPLKEPEGVGAGFAVVGRQKRIVLDGDDYSIDLLFFHRRLRRPADSGQVERCRPP
jgi:hypothetical protein